MLNWKAGTGCPFCSQYGWAECKVIKDGLKSLTNPLGTGLPCGFLPSAASSINLTKCDDKG